MALGLRLHQHRAHRQGARERLETEEDLDPRTEAALELRVSAGRTVVGNLRVTAGRNAHTL